MPVHIALVDDTEKISPAALAEVAGAINQQIQQDFAPAWKVAASIGTYPAAPPGTWAVHVQDQLDEPGALGYHSDESNQPVAHCELTGDWSVTVSHEVLEMLADPWGNRMHPGMLPIGIYADHFGLRPGVRVRYLLEVCDPPEAHPYKVGNVNVSDFILPPWYGGPGPATHAGGAQHREVADGGYVSFQLPSGEWYQVFNEGGQLQTQDLGRFDRQSFGSLREFTDYHARMHRAGA
jgi:hypothetical protein